MKLKLIERINVVKKARLYVFLYILLLSTFTILPPVDRDFGWHYVYGKYIFEKQSILKENTLSYTLADYEWANSYWLSEVVIYILFSRFGHVVTTLLLNFSIYSYFWVFVLENKSIITKTILTFLFCMTCLLFKINVRPIYFSTFLLIILIYLLTKRDNIKSFKELPLLFLLWANTHADWVLGLIILGAYSFFKTFDLKFKLNKLPNISIKSVNLRKYLILGILCFVITIANPFGIRLWNTLLYETGGVFSGYIGEFSPLKLTGNFQTALFLYTLAALIVINMIFNYKKIPAWLNVCLLFFLLMGLRGQYFLRVFSVLGIYSLVEPVEGIGRKYNRYFERIWRLSFMKTYTSIVWIFLFIITLQVSITYSTETTWAEKTKYPQDALNYIRENKPTGNMFNSYNWGGYLIWKLPEYKTFVDGRMSSWKKADGTLFM